MEQRQAPEPPLIVKCETQGKLGNLRAPLHRAVLIKLVSGHVSSVSTALVSPSISPQLLGPAPYLGVSKAVKSRPICGVDAGTRSYVHLRSQWPLWLE